MPTQKRKHRTISEIQNIISSQKASGQSQEKFCKEKQIPISTFTNWVSKQPKASLSNLPALIPVGSVQANCPAIEIKNISFNNKSKQNSTLRSVLRSCIAASVPSIPGPVQKQCTVALNFASGRLNASMKLTTTSPACYCLRTNRASV